MRSLRVQLLVSHLLLVLLMAGVMSGALVNFVRLGHSIEGILRDNYDSVIAAENMKESLERQDSAATFFLAGQTQKARGQYQVNWPLFQHWADVESHNITEVGEQQMSNDIGRQFPAYRQAIERLLYARPPMPPSRQRAFYFLKLEPAFLRLKQRAQDVLNVNQAAIVRADRRAKADARRASLTGLGLTVAALLLALFLAGRTIRDVLTPLRTFARQAEEIGAGHLDQRIALPRQDEIGALATSFNDMARKLGEARRLEEQRLHRAERMSDAALENLFDPVIVTDAEARVVHLNRAAEGLFGPATRAAGGALADVVREARITRAVSHVIRQECVSAGEDDAALIPLQVGGATRTYRLRATPMRDADALLGAVAVLEDVTHLRELDRLKTEFISVASHELRTPVTSLLLSVQLLQEGAVGPLTPEQWEVVAAQREDLERLERMMRDLLDMTRLEAGVVPPRLEIVPPRELVRSAVAAVAAQAQAKGVALREEVAEDLPDVRADRTQMMRVLVNLLGNALRHTPPGGAVTAWTEARGASVALVVEDTGTGIPPDYLPQIFERFVQVPGATRGGAGLGLSLAWTIVTAHGGEITAASELGQGSTFTVTLPAVPPATDETHE